MTLSTINKRILKLSSAAFLFASLMFSPISMGHHSFAIYDFDIRTEFKGEIKSIKFRNPHISMVLNHVTENGDIQEVSFIEGAPANMLVRTGLRPDMVSPGTVLTVVGSPLREDDTKFFIHTMTLEDGSQY
jgi:hypothetical protein